MAYNNTNTNNLNNTTSTGGLHNNSTSGGVLGNHHNSTSTSSTGGAIDHVKSFLTSSRKEDTTEVCTETAAPVVQEHVERIETVDQVEAIDRERHIHHHQHRIQPIVDHVELPTEHKYQIVPEIVRESKHDMLPEHREKLEQQRQLYHDTREVGEVKRVVQVAPAVAAEHVHHHVHETIQPVINRETIQKTHVHTTIPIHEKIHDAPIVHEHTVLPTVSLRDFEAKVGGTHLHKDSTHQHAYYEGSPRVGGGVTDHNTTGLTGATQNLNLNNSTSSHHNSTHGSGLAGAAAAVTGNHNTTSSHNNTATHGTGLAGAASALTGSHNNTANRGTGLTGGTLPNTGLGSGDHTLHDSVNRGQYDARDANHDGKVDRHEKKDTNHDGRVDSHDKKTGLGGLIASVTGKQ